jgi:hypothetical protein
MRGRPGRPGEATTQMALQEAIKLLHDVETTKTAKGSTVERKFSNCTTARLPRFS